VENKMTQDEPQKQDFERKYSEYSTAVAGMKKAVLPMSAQITQFGSLRKSGDILATLEIPQNRGLFSGEMFALIEAIQYAVETLPDSHPIKKLRPSAPFDLNPESAEFQLTELTRAERSHDHERVCLEAFVTQVGKIVPYDKGDFYVGGITPYHIACQSVRNEILGIDGLQGATVEQSLKYKNACDKLLEQGRSLLDSRERLRSLFTLACRGMYTLGRCGIVIDRPGKTKVDPDLLPYHKQENPYLQALGWAYQSGVADGEELPQIKAREEEGGASDLEKAYMETVDGRQHPGLFAQSLRNMAISKFAGREVTDTYAEEYTLVEEIVLDDSQCLKGAAQQILECLEGVGQQAQGEVE